MTCRESAVRAGLLLAVALSACRPAVDVDLVIRGGVVIDGVADEPVAADIFVKDGRIVEVAPPGAPASEAAREIDATGRYLIPGLTDAHVHFRLGAPMRRGPDETAQALSRALYYGVTTILQMGATGASVDSIRALRARQADGTLVAPTIYASGGHLTVPGSHPLYTILSPAVRVAADSLLAATPDSVPVELDGLGLGLAVVRDRSAARAAVARRADAGMDFIKITIESGPTPFGDDHPQMSLDMARGIVAAARDRDLPVFAHATSLDELETALDAGAAGIVHAVRNEPLPGAALMDRMARSGFFVVPTLVLFTPPDLDDPFLRESVSEAEVAALTNPGFLDRFGRIDCCLPYEAVAENVARLHGRGVGLVVGTDTGNPYVLPGYGVHREMELLVDAGLSPAEALEAATRSAARMLGKGSEFGALEVGMRADIVVLDGNPLADIRNTRLIDVVIAAGRVVERSELSIGR